MITSMQKIKDINCFFPNSLLIKESFNLIAWEIQQATTNQKVLVSGPTFPSMTISMQKQLRSLDSFHIFWWSKNPTIW